MERLKKKCDKAKTMSDKTNCVVRYDRNEILKFEIFRRARAFFFFLLKHRNLKRNILTRVKRLRDIRFEISRRTISSAISPGLYGFTINFDVGWSGALGQFYNSFEVFLTQLHRESSRLIPSFSLWAVKFVFLPPISLRRILPSILRDCPFSLCHQTLRYRRIGKK